MYIQTQTFVCLYISSQFIIEKTVEFSDLYKAYYPGTIIFPELLINEKNSF